MNYSKRKMTETAGNPQGFWGRKMLNRMNDRHKGLIKWGLEGTDFSKHRDVLDIGCGSGNALAMMYHKNKKAHYFGVDYSKDSVKIARKNNKEAVERGHIKIAHADVVDMPYKNDSFDLIISIESFYYWKDYEKAAREISRVLKKNGTLIIVLEAHNDVPDPEQYDEIKSMIDNFVVPGEKELAEFFAAAGLSFESVKKDNWIRATGSLK